ncbi:uncharacterized protein [Coffea arabica]|uniref:Reverse transcriptase domain-containing protein n=1 Tax=Coffea arabica TaxID=13443 RepID=A0A6P6VKG7_COFAR|nr:uncharacterized protein LOC113723642 [Coffea arabica]XP_027102437.1 uncharacterized protein LOC113723645 [Coffea arabica]
MNGVSVDEQFQIESMVIEYFSEVLAQQAQVPVDHSLLDIIPSVVSEHDNEILQQLPTEDEIQRVVFQMNGDSYSGPATFTGSFFTTCWDVVKRDVCRAVGDFFTGAELLWGYTATLLALISKSGFVKGRQISDNILLALEMCSGLGRKVRGANVALKLDMAKAYDRLVYANDIIIFWNGTTRLLSCVMDVLDKYQRSSEQQVNASKSCFLLGKGVSLAHRKVISQVTGFSAKDLPITYLGCPLYVGRWMKGLFTGLLDKVSQ